MLYLILAFIPDELHSANRATTETYRCSWCCVYLRKPCRSCRVKVANPLCPTTPDYWGVLELLPTFDMSTGSMVHRTSRQKNLLILGRYESDRDPPMSLSQTHPLLNFAWTNWIELTQ
ncbi:hypothetical protein BIW11_10696 [Tropilaelaps mercedesae]|uniref:Uncharacterized protein n=1 Tax=Tropilaelaps mercedesae TaxID=418985 RepID=A0A1V9XEZ1_9ACAR|nr:hypothetical protein BIW11_10696 [Tropilaelaps mercedesae]